MRVVLVADRSEGCKGKMVVFARGRIRRGTPGLVEDKCHSGRKRMDKQTNKI